MSTSSFSLPDVWVEQLNRQHFPAAALYVLATPIGNLADISLRALHVLNLVDAIACEDTRTSAHMLRHYGIHKPLLAAHQHNEERAARDIVARLQSGERIALISDAGTPAVSDPGARIVAAVHAAGLRVLPLPGACAAITALSVAGLPDDPGFHFIGFLPSKASQRARLLADLRNHTGSLIFYEAPHRIAETLTALTAAFPAERTLLIARELCKLFEEVHRGPLDEALPWLIADPQRQKGEFVLVLQGADAHAQEHASAGARALALLLEHLPLKDAAAVAAQLTGAKKNALYTLGLQLRGKAGNEGAEDDEADEEKESGR